MERAASLYNDMKADLDRYRTNVAFNWNTTGPDKDGMYSHWQIPEPPFPGGIEDKIADLVHNLRSSLDLLVYDTATIKGVSPKDVFFPFANNENALAIMLNDPKKPLKKMGPVFHEMIKKMRPYKGEGGNALLRGLHDLDIRTKHHTVIEVVIFRNTRLGMMGIKLMGAEMLNQANPGYVLDPENPQPLTIPKWERIMKIGVIHKSINADPMSLIDPDFFEFKDEIYPAFSEGTPFHDKLVIPVIVDMMYLVSEIADNFRLAFLGRSV
jgi:hypothetical protein